MLSRLQGYHRPKSIAEALALLEKNSGTILVIAGGTKLTRAENDTVQELVDITSLDLHYIREGAGMLRIGATTPLQRIIESPNVKNLCNGILSEAALLSQHSKMIRNVSTLGGELVSTTPLSVLYCALLALQAQVRITGGEEFALAMNIFLNKKGLDGGLLIEILIPRTERGTYAAVSDISTSPQAPPLVAACTRLSLKDGRCHDVKIALTGTDRVPQRQQQAEILLEGQPLTNANLQTVADKVYKEYQPVSDALASEEYRKEVGRLVVKKALKRCWQHAEEDL